VQHVKLLLDENLSLSVAVALCAEGIDVVHLRDRGPTSATDAEVLDRAYAEDRILVTANVDDFEKLAGARELHAGIVLVERRRPAARRARGGDPAHRRGHRRGVRRGPRHGEPHREGEPSGETDVR
jgi:hypothetical protein